METFRSFYLEPLLDRPFIAFIDITIVTFLFYHVFIAIRKTRGMQLLLAMAAVWISGMISSYLGLELFTWIVDGVRSALIFAVIVLLQPEIRKLAIDFTKINIFQSSTKSIEDLNETIDALKVMMNSKTGSLIAITRNNDLREIIENGVKIDGNISSSLLLTIFKKNSPLHDGCVVIHKNKIAAAGTFLPMSNDLDKNLGARHRAALGLSEQTDAVIITCSEETGELSLCFDGKIYHPIKLLEIKKLINEVLDGSFYQNNTNSENRREVIAPS